MKKKTHRQFLQLFSLFCFFMLFLFSPSGVLADDPNETFLFKKMIVLNIDDHTGEDYGEKIERTVRAEMEQMFRFSIPADKVTVRYPLDSQSLAKISKKFQSDGFIAGGIFSSNKKLNIYLEIFDQNGIPFALELLAVNERISQADLEKSVRELVIKLIHRIPYKAVVTRVQDGLVTFDAGRIHGVEIGSKVSLFEIAGVKRHPFTNEVISFNREDLGQVQVTEVKSLSATGKIIRIKKGSKISAGQKVDFIPSEKAIRESQAEKKALTAKQSETAPPRKTEKQQAVKASPKRPRGSLTAGTGFAINEYQFKSDQLNFKRHTSPVPIVTVAGEYWFFSPLGADVSYATSWMGFDQTGGVPQTDATASWFAAHLKYRYFFSSGPLSPEIIGSVGYRVYDFHVSGSDLTFFNDIKYSGLDLALAATYPITSRIKGTLNLAYQPTLTVNEDPVTSGADSSAYGYSLGLTGHFKIYNSLALTLGYQYQAYHAKFDGLGTRNQPAGTTNASIDDAYHEFLLNLIYEF